MTSINFSELQIQKLSAIHDTSRFDCDDKDINEFLQQDALMWQQRKLAITHLVIYNEQIVGFYCTSADSIKLKLQERKEENNLDKKRITEVPAVKIGRLGVHKDHQRQGLGTFILQRAIGHILSTSEAIGVRFVTVDAYPEMQKWYEKRGFKINAHADYKPKENISMRLCLYNPAPQTKQ